MRGKKMSVENLQYKINDRLEKRLSSIEKIVIDLKEDKKLLNQLLSVATVILFNESSLKSLTNDNIKNVMTPKIHEAIKSINEGLKI
jgi:hypothetical protein